MCVERVCLHSKCFVRGRGACRGREPRMREEMEEKEVRYGDGTISTPEKWASSRAVSDPLRGGPREFGEGLFFFKTRPTNSANVFEL